MPKHIFRRYSPSPEQIQKNKSLRFLAPFFNRTNLWHINRRGVSRAFLIGVFSAFLPLPFQMVIAALLAFHFKANLPIAIGLVWISNPVTIPPIFYSTYIIGTWILGVPATEFNIELSVSWVLSEIANIWLPLLVGSLSMGILLSALSYFVIDALWQMHVAHNWKKRQRKRAGSKDTTSN